MSGIRDEVSVITVNTQLLLAQERGLLGTRMHWLSLETARERNGVVLQAKSKLDFPLHHL
jgi:hypothetical protein